MSNIIKSSIVKIDTNEKKLINTAFLGDEKEKNSKDIPKPVITRDLQQVLKEKERMLRDEEANLKVKYQNVIEQAELRADEILNEARVLSQKIREEALVEGKEEGYRLGINEANEEILAIKSELVHEKSKMEDVFNEKVGKFEVDFINVFASLCEKTFGILLDEKKDIILHVINKTISDVEKSNNYIIRVSREDYELVSNNKRLLCDYIPDGANIEILESDNLIGNKCLIETDNSVIDCSVDTQMRNLISDLQMLSKL